jgi:hypothetical protein
MQEIVIDGQYLPPLSRVFSPIVIDSIAEKGILKILKRGVPNKKRRILICKILLFFLQDGLQIEIMKI